MAAADTAIDSSVRSSFTAFDRTMSEWRDKLLRWRCGLSATERARCGGPANWDCKDVQFFVGRVDFEQLGRKRASDLSAIPTRLKLEREEVDKVVAAGRDALRSNPTFRAFLSNL
jgi:NTE family protein